ncbi:cadmium-translocating P-type ATPase [Aggregatimonas sangjinii]|uniref:P-type Zn(2+) transporter n=1 Tax=Aggregatimonas sangjinii TaxID=2583587 RepID=A0A5B7SLD0_9FLAO|nr:heavy metal translocating P-type ATPase [Aggregatimonas sangjinii]QCW98871.1 cadmium-translocating P-type ATPase [Aggregatimonas sangjinii]
MCAEHEHDHAHGILGKNTELYFALLSGATLLVGFLLEKFTDFDGNISWGFYLAAYFFGGYFVSREAVTEISKGKFEIDFLMLVAAMGAGFLGNWAEGGLLLFLFSLGHALEHYAMGKARKSIAALTELAPKTALLKKKDGFLEVGIETLRLGDTIIVKPGTKISADGFVVKGQSTVDQAPITGESIPVDKVPVARPDLAFENPDDIPSESRVFSGTINGSSTLEVTVTKIAADSTLSRLVTMVQEAQQQKSPTQLLTDTFQKYYVPAVIALVILLNFAFMVIDETWSESFYRSMAVLVAASPCALAISTPSAVLSGIARAARGGVLVKGGRPLEDLGNLTALAFDKTGTLTEGKPKVTDVIPLGEGDKNDLLKILVSVEKLSNHPIAKAIVRDGLLQLNGADFPEADSLEEIQGKGIKANLDRETIRIGNLKIFEGETIDPALLQRISTLETEGKTSMLIQREGDFIGIVGVMDVPRKMAKPTLSKLRRLGIKKMVMLTGDNQKVATAVAEQIGITEARGSLLPEEKVAVVQELMAKENKLAMIGDGVNDAPAMAHSTVGIAMGAAGSDVALETADIALMADKLETLPFAIGLSRKASAIIKQNLWISLGMVVLLIPATLLNWANIGVAVAFHEGSTLIVVLNALRLLAYKEKSKGIF